jgi:hypothetical protein
MAEQVPQVVAPVESHFLSEWLSVDKQLPPLDWVSTQVYWLWSHAQQKVDQAGESDNCNEHIAIYEYPGELQ